MSLLIWTIASVLAASAVAASEEEKRRELVNKAWEHYLLRETWRDEVRPEHVDAYLVHLDELQEAGELPPGWQWWKVYEGWIPLPRGWIGYVEDLYRNWGPREDQGWSYTTKIVKLLDPVVYRRSRDQPGVSLSLLVGEVPNSIEDVDVDIEREPYCDNGLIVVLEDRDSDGSVRSRTYGEMLEELGPQWRNDLLLRTGLNDEHDAPIPMWLVTYDDEDRDPNVFDHLERVGLYLATIDGYPAYIELDEELFEYPDYSYEEAILDALRFGFRLAWIPDHPNRNHSGRWYVVHPLPEAIPDWTGWNRMLDAPDRDERNRLAREATRPWCPPEPSEAP